MSPEEMLELLKLFKLDICLRPEKKVEFYPEMIYAADDVELQEFFDFKVNNKVLLFLRRLRTELVAIEDMENKNLGFSVGGLIHLPIKPSRPGELEEKNLKLLPSGEIQQFEGVNLEDFNGVPKRLHLIRRTSLEKGQLGISRDEISSNHGKLIYDTITESFYIKDTCSLNGIFVKCPMRDSFRVTIGPRLRVGGKEIKFDWENVDSNILKVQVVTPRPKEDIKVIMNLEEIFCQPQSAKLEIEAEGDLFKFCLDEKTKIPMIQILHPDIWRRLSGPRQESDWFKLKNGDLIDFGKVIQVKVVIE
eukprot:TRINITY_DN5374_c0_g1_i5.p1 TRINITY_DN5374_c0_g1~~TRINITY_DN5374_c0_g1_i5.p1  ORF type:complete len:305 (-),score=48.13 TRINITY_DN5374_c0_g1_i5:147-1061(-)